MSVPERRPSSPQTVTIVAAIAAGALTAGGVAAYLMAGKQVSDSEQSCAQVNSFQPCDGPKNAVRAWDWVAVGAWAGAAAAGAVAIVSFVRSRGDAARTTPSARLVVAPVSMGLEGTF